MESIENTEGLLIANVSIMRSARCGTAWAEVQVQHTRRVILEIMSPDPVFPPTESFDTFIYTDMARVATDACVEAVATVYFTNRVGHWDPKYVESCG
jgi:hypothetical protein